MILFLLWALGQFALGLLSFLRVACVVCVAFSLYLSLLYMARVPYACRPYLPTGECETGLYELLFFEKAWFRYPSGKVEAHCVFEKADRLVATKVKFTAYSYDYPLHREPSDVWWAEEQEFPPLNERTTLCRVSM